MCECDVYHPEQKEEVSSKMRSKQNLRTQTKNEESLLNRINTIIFYSQECVSYYYHSPIPSIFTLSPLQQRTNLERQSPS